MVGGPFQQDFDLELSDEEASAKADAENFNTINNSGSASMEALVFPLSIISGPSAMPLYSALVNLKLTEKLGYVSLNYGSRLSIFF